MVPRAHARSCSPWAPAEHQRASLPRPPEPSLQRGSADAVPAPPSASRNLAGSATHHSITCWHTLRCGKGGLRGISGMGGGGGGGPVWRGAVNDLGLSARWLAAAARGGVWLWRVPDVWARPACWTEARDLAAISFFSAPRTTTARIRHRSSFSSTYVVVYFVFVVVVVVVDLVVRSFGCLCFCL